MKIVVLDGFTSNPGDNPWDKLASLGDLTVYERTPPELTVERSRDATVVLTNKVALNRSVLDQLPSLKFVSVLATGYDVVDVGHAQSLGILVSNVPVYSTDSVAQFVIAAMLSYVHRPFEHHLAIQEGEWAERGEFSFWLTPLRELRGKTFGVYGWGRIGQATGKLAAAFGMTVIAASRTERCPLTTPEFEFVSREELFARSDFLSLHCPATPETVGSIDRVLLAQMQSHAVLINTARGSLIVESDLAAALNRGVIGGAILDVVSQEPINADNPLLTAKNCRLTPHIAWATVEARRRLMQTTCENVAAFLAGRPVNVVMPKV